MSKPIFIISLSIHDIERLACNTKWGFFISSMLAHIIISKRELMRDEKYMLSGCELIDTENISLPSQNMKFVGE